MNAALGFAIATVARSQLAGIGVGIGVFFAEGIAGAFLPQVFKWFPFSAASAVVASTGGSNGGGPAPVRLEPDMAIVVVLVWLVAALVVASLWTERAEIAASSRPLRGGARVVMAPVLRYAGEVETALMAERARRGAPAGGVSGQPRRAIGASRRVRSSRGEVGGRQLDLQAAPAGGHVDRRERRGRRVDAVGSRRFVPSGLIPPSTYPVARSASAASAIDAAPTAQRVGDRLQVHLGVGGHDRQPELPVDRDHDRLEHPRGVEAERGHRLQRIAAAALAQRRSGVMRIFMHGIHGPRAARRIDRARSLSDHAGHCRVCSAPNGGRRRPRMTAWAPHRTRRIFAVTAHCDRPSEITNNLAL